MHSCTESIRNMSPTLSGWFTPLASSFAIMGFLTSLFLYCDFADWIPLYPLVFIESCAIVCWWTRWLRCYNRVCPIYSFRVVIANHSTTLSHGDITFTCYLCTYLIIVFCGDGADLPLCFLNNSATCIPRIWHGYSCSLPTYTTMIFAHLCCTHANCKWLPTLLGSLHILSFLVS